MNIAKALIGKHSVSQLVTVVGPLGYAYQLDSAENILVEGAQGYSLSMYHGFYPYTTSRDVSTAQLMADCGIPISPDYPLEVIGTARTFPIRVANRYNEHGEQVGFSGPNYPDQKEISFAEIGQDIELTTVTKLPRRIFTFSISQIKHAVRQCGIKEIFLNFANYVKEESALDAMIESISKHTGAKVRWLGYGPSVDDVVDLNSPDHGTY